MLFGTSKIDLILLDIMLPGKISGYDIFDEIKLVPRLQDTPIVAVTASDPDIEVPKAKEKGFNGYVSKPIDRNQFPHDMLKVIEGGEVWPE
jgi:CheY-like chemotaxis protein